MVYILNRILHSTTPSDELPIRTLDLMTTVRTVHFDFLSNASTSINVSGVRLGQNYSNLLDLLKVSIISGAL